MRKAGRVAPPNGRSAIHSESAFPETIDTSSARRIRWVSPAISRPWLTGSCRSSSAYRAGSPSAARRARSSARTVSSPGGIGLIPSKSARR